MVLTLPIREVLDATPRARIVRLGLDAQPFAFLAGQAVLVRIVGVLVLALCGVAGQLAAALSLDLLLPTSARPVDLATIGGTVLALVAVIIASLGWTRRRHAIPPLPRTGAVPVVGDEEIVVSRLAAMRSVRRSARRPSGSSTEPTPRTRG